MLRSLSQHLNSRHCSLQCRLCPGNIRLRRLAAQSLFRTVQCCLRTVFIDLIRPFDNLCQNGNSFGKDLGESGMQCCLLLSVLLRNMQDTRLHDHRQGNVARKDTNLSFRGIEFYHIHNSLIEYSFRGYDTKCEFFICHICTPLSCYA